MSNPFNFILSSTADRRASLSALPSENGAVISRLSSSEVGDENANPKNDNGNDNDGIRKTTSDDNLNKFNQMIAAACSNTSSSHSKTATMAKSRSKRASVSGNIVNASKTLAKSIKSSSSSNAATPSTKKHLDSNKVAVHDKGSAAHPCAKKTIKQVDEVHILISRLKTLVGDLDEKAILDNYHRKNATTAAAGIQEGVGEGGDRAIVLSPKKSEDASSSSSSSSSGGASTIITFRSPEKNAAESSVEYDITYSLVIDESGDDGTTNPMKNCSIRVSEALPRRRLPTRYSLGSKRFSLDIPGRRSLGAPLNSMGPKYRSFSGDSDMSECGYSVKNFTHFYSVGASRGVLGGWAMPERHCSLQPATLLDSYPSGAEALAENVQDYCFPEGVVARIVLKSQAARYIGSSNDKYHLMQFSDATGTATYGCCLVITEALPFVNATAFEHLVEKEQMDSASSKICQAVSAYAARRRVEKRRNAFSSMAMQCKSPFLNATSTVPKTPGGSVMSRIKQSLETMSIAKSHSKFLTFASDLISTPSVDTVSKKQLKMQNAEDPVVQQYLRLIQNGHEGCGDSDLSEEEEEEVVGKGEAPPSAASSASAELSARIPQAELECAAPAVIHSAPADSSPLSAERRRRLRMEECLLLTERAFCLVSERPHPSFLFKVLQAVANKERPHGDEQLDSSSAAAEGAAVRARSESVATAMSEGSLASSSGADGLAHDLVYESRRSRRQNFLEYMKELKTARAQLASFPSYSPPFRLEARATTLEESSVAAVFCTLPMDAVLKITSLLLTEKSLVIFGTHAGAVSAVATGLCSLLKPFSWEGIFVPLMPQTAREVLQAPVPFIIGTLRAPQLESLSESAAVLYLDDYLDDSSSSSSTSTGHARRYLYNPADADPEYFFDPSKGSDYREMKGRLSRLVQQLKLPSGSQSTLSKRSASLQLTTLLAGMQSAEKSVVREILAVMCAHNKKLCGDLFSPSGWRSYGAVNSATGDFEFYPQWFMDPLQMQLKFQEKVIHTQMFVGLMDRKRADYTSLRARSRRFLSEWLFYRWMLVGRARR